MIADILLVCGVAVLTWALRTFRHPLLHRAGTIGIFVTSFLAGWLLGGTVWIGLLLAGSWLLLPWVEILTHIRTLRLPEKPHLAPCAPPSAQDFPALEELTEEVEREHFEHVVDACWEQDGLRQFYRLFYWPAQRLQAVICLIEQHDLRFFYLSVNSRAATSQEEFITWNYPFSYGLKIPKHWRIQRLMGEMVFAHILQRHGQFLARHGLKVEDLEEQAADSFLENMARRSGEQTRYNVQAGILCPTPSGKLRYSVWGMLYLWRQFLGDLIRLS